MWLILYTEIFLKECLSSSVPQDSYKSRDLSLRQLLHNSFVFAKMNLMVLQNENLAIQAREKLIFIVFLTM